MDAPTPSNEKQIESKNVNFISCNKNYILQYKLYSAYITFSIDSIEDKEMYESNFSFDEITQMNRYFLICESIKDVYDEISSLIDNKKFEINILNKELNLK